MSSVFTAFCFIKTISRNNKFVTGTALYRINNEDDEFREIIYKGFTRTAETLISDFEKNSIVLIIRRYIYQNNIEYVCLVQTILVFSFHNGSACIPDDLPYAFPLLMYSAPTITNSYKANDNVGHQRFMLLKKLYNPITGQKAIDSNVIVSYTNINGRYDSLKNSIKRTVVSVIGRLKLSFQSKIPHIISSEIEWSYPSNESQSSSLTINAKLKTRKELNSQLDLIEEQYSTMESQAFKRRKGLTPFASATTISISPLSASNTSTSTFSVSPAYASTSTSSSATTSSSKSASAAVASTSISAPATTNSFMSTSTTIYSPMPNPPNINPSNLVSQISENKPTLQNSSNNLPTADNKLNE
ncbi:hypothetical protein F8M41_002678 [Gigaspora margarita]|uniref:Uncharacterized protein n=1 Tax=Gigaspora margarita TaxID=4874 RepID=A0A8H4AYD5_GIGMA|nr:hypothetical protein F8M41_002678 [Gigaspora margarita]